MCAHLGCARSMHGVRLKDKCNVCESMNCQREKNLGKLKMRKVLIIALGFASLGAITAAQQASANPLCKPVCDQWGPGKNGQPRCFSAHMECPDTKASVGGSGGHKTIQQKKTLRQ